MPNKESNFNKNSKEAKFQDEPDNMVKPDEVSSSKASMSGGDHNVTVDTNMGSTLKQEKVATMIAPSDGSSNNFGFQGINMLASGFPVSGSVETNLGSENATPRGDNTRKDSRYGKKIERLTNKINYTPSEQYEKAYLESKPLSMSKDASQGYVGNYHDETYRVQKIGGSSPAERQYDRSLDYTEKDKIYFSQGQQYASEFKDYPTTTFNKETHEYEDILIGDQIQRENVINTDLVVSFNEDGTLKEFFFDNHKVNPEYNVGAANVANTNAAVNRNVIELDREAIDSNAGDEADAKWCPLGRAINQPNEYLNLMQDIEAQTGAEVYTAIKKMESALSFQLNRSLKDGKSLQGPGVEFLCGNVANRMSSTDYDAMNITNLLKNSNQYYRRGSSAIMINLYDSARKYNDKADLLTQPRGFKMHLATALSNSDPLRIDKRFVNAFRKHECYSTIDGSYDCTKPILMTDKASLIHTIDMNAFGAFAIDGSFKDAKILFPDMSASDVKKLIGKGDDDYNPSKFVNNTYTDYTDEQKDIYVHYKVTPDNDSNNDISIAYDYDSTHKKLYIYNGSTTNGNDSGMIEFKISNSTDTITGYTLINQAIPDGGQICTCIGGEEQEDHSFICTDNKILKLNPADPYSINPSFCYGYSNLRNWYPIDIKHPLIEGLKDFFNVMGTKFYQELGLHRLYIPTIHSTRSMSLWSLILCAATPFILDERIKVFRDVLDYEKNFGYPFSSLITLKEAKEMPYENFTFTDTESLLKIGSLNKPCKIEWTMPEFFWTINVDDISNEADLVLPWYANEHSYHNDINSVFKFGGDDSGFADAKMSWPSVRAGICLQNLNDLASSDELNTRMNMDMIVDFASQFGDDAEYVGVYKYGRTTDGQPVIHIDKDNFSIAKLISLPRQFGFSMDAPGGALTPKTNSGYYLPNIDATAVDKTSYRAYMYMNTSGETHEDILDVTSLNIDRAGNFTQKYVRYDAMPADSEIADTDYGPTLGFGKLYDEGELQTKYSVMKPFANRHAAPIETDLSLVSNFRGYYDRLQMIPFIISPFDMVNMFRGTPSHYDIYDAAYIFGLCGFLASDYNEDVDLRQREYFAKGVNYTADTWFEKSYLYS